LCRLPSKKSENEEGKMKNDMCKVRRWPLPLFNRSRWRAPRQATSTTSKVCLGVNSCKARPTVLLKNACRA
jgi:hypothetical protein